MSFTEMMQQVSACGRDLEGRRRYVKQPSIVSAYLAAGLPQVDVVVVHRGGTLLYRHPQHSSATSTASTESALLTPQIYR